MFSIRRLVVAAAGLAVGALLCWLVFRDTDWTAVWAALRRAHPGYLAACALCFAGTYFARALRLRGILRAQGPAPYRTAFSAMMISILAQMLLPVLRVPLIQSVALSRLLPRPLAQCFGATAVDRMLEAAGLPIFMLIVLAATRGGNDFIVPASVFATDSPLTVSAMAFRGGMMTFTAMIAMGMAVLVLLYRKRVALAERAGQWSPRAGEAVQVFTESLHVFSDGRNVARTVLANVLLWTLFLCSVTCALEAFGVPWPWYGPLLMLTLMVVSIILPGAPGFVGQFHFAVVTSVVMLAPDYPVADAKALAIALHFIFISCVGVLGVASVLREHMNVLELGRSAERAVDSALP